ncbi:hypothetical protein BpHYR1_024953 [Brachionus plicatilis]|uniref:Uncharacterized protein n=1 Tax=Brachionus plicatilis TaxID=10195 RepID=A0A3M7PWA8_BRAPC|nr:hypothetical protein BpHYR1_024953 [Brachionus plicatilis]
MMFQIKFSSLIFLFFKIGLCKKIENIPNELDPAIDINKCSDFMRQSGFSVLAIKLHDRIYFREFNIAPRIMLILDKSLKMDFDSKLLADKTHFRLANIKGIDISSSPFNFFSTIISLNFYYSYFFLYFNKSKIHECTRRKFSPFKNVNAIKFSTSVKFYQNTCPFVFSNLSLSILEFYGISDIFLKKNYLSFETTNETIHLKIIFIKQLHLTGSIEEAESDCLFAFRELSWLKVGLDAFLSGNSEWLFSYLKQIENDLFVNFLSPDWYQYPNEDMCLFRKFPKNGPIFPIIQTKSCSCTIIWILQNNDQLRTEKNRKLNFNLCSNKTCDFDQMISKCVKPKDVKFFPNKIDVLFETTKCARFAYEHNKCVDSLAKKKQRKQKFDVQTDDFEFNFKLYLFVLAQLYDIYIVEFLGSILKTLSNCLMAMISFNRYFLLKGNIKLEEFYSKFQKYYFKSLTLNKLGRSFSNEIENKYIFSYIIFIAEFLLNDLMCY